MLSVGLRRRLGVRASDEVRITTPGLALTAVIDASALLALLFVLVRLAHPDTRPRPAGLDEGTVGFAIVIRATPRPVEVLGRRPWTWSGFAWRGRGPESADLYVELGAPGVPPSALRLRPQPCGQLV